MGIALFKEKGVEKRKEKIYHTRRKREKELKEVT